MKYALLVLALSVLALTQFSYASYTVTHLNVTAQLNKNTSAYVNEVLTVKVSNDSVKQYTTNRLALNLTLSTWQSLVGPMLVQHLVNPVRGVYNFRFLPGAIFKNGTGNYAYLLMSYDVANATNVQQTGPRAFKYSFNTNIFNFEHGVSGEVLPANTTFTLIVPSGAVITSVYPVPDAPVSAFTTGYSNITRVSWFYGEPLSTFTFTFTLQESIETEVMNFFSGVNRALGYGLYIIIALVILGLIVYIYVKAGR
ncbi:MAG: hypothetical protein M1360_03135 [Candidatus Marsarchaeota archaeon]|jgi:hypothetical protein|nr:hypothetical protein [Candidatus Marsarchaeota archaeon]MCL5418908.1 hypothetical protein [Candidatus Marsarchaeota archaeon]